MGREGGRGGEGGWVWSIVQYCLYLLPFLSRNCPDYDLCQSCEGSSQIVHPRSHVFLKIKTPVHNKLDQPGVPLLRGLLYQQEGPKDMAALERSEKSSEKVRRHHHHHHPKSHHQQKPEVSAGGFVSRSREQLREEMKQRRKLDKKRPQPDHVHVSSSRPRVKPEPSLTEKDKACPQKGHGK